MMTARGTVQNSFVLSVIGDHQSSNHHVHKPLDKTNPLAREPRAQIITDLTAGTITRPTAETLNLASINGFTVCGLILIHGHDPDRLPGVLDLCLRKCAPTGAIINLTHNRWLTTGCQRPIMANESCSKLISIVTSAHALKISSRFLRTCRKC